MKINQYFSIIVVKHSDQELREIYQEYLTLVKNSSKKTLSYQEYLKVPHLNHYVDMKCMVCQYEERAHYGEFALNIEEYDFPFPQDFCPNCSESFYMAKDVIDKLND